MTPPDAVKLWKDNVVFRRGLAASGVAQPFTIDDAMPSVPAPERRPYAASVDWADRPPTLDGEVGAEEWPGQGLSLSRAPSRWNTSGLPVSAELSHDGRYLYAAAVVGVYRPPRQPQRVHLLASRGPAFVLGAGVCRPPGRSVTPAWAFGTPGTQYTNGA